MALAEQVKKGGPYTKKEQDERKQEVFKLHFEKGYSAMKISEMLNVNRNTINEDIRHWYSELAQELKDIDLTSWAIEQYHRLEAQRNRLVDELEKQENIQHKIAIEKLISEVDNRLTPFVSRISLNNISPNTNDEEELMERTKGLVKHILLSEDIEPQLHWLQDDILFYAIKKYKCDYAYAQAIFANMESLGLKLCQIFESNNFTYDLIKFAEMRSFLSEKEIRHAEKRLDDKFEEEENQEKEREERGKKLTEKYGDKSKWTSEIWDEYEFGES